MKVRTFGFIVAGMFTLLLYGCLQPGGHDNGDDFSDTDKIVNPDCDVNADDDFDGITNGDEGCQYNTDSDNDGQPDYLDPDSDNDGISDAYEAGDDDPATPPPDHDGDGRPDFRDTDSDNDGINDGDEDRNHDGLVGKCKKTCVYGSTNEDDSCGPGQICLGDNTCAPYYSFDCAEGETDPYNSDTDEDGIPDGEEGTFVCNPVSEFNPNGRRPVKFEQMTYEKIGIEQEAAIVHPVIQDATGHEELITHDLTDDNYEVAGFTLTMDLREGENSVEDVFLDIKSRLSQAFGSTRISMRTSGNVTQSHEDFPTIVGAIFDINTDTFFKPGDIRNNVVYALFGKGKGSFDGMPTSDGFSSDYKEFVLSFTVQIAQPKDPNSGDITDTYIVIQGGVTSKLKFENVQYHSAISLSDLSNSTGFARFNSNEENECETYIVATIPTADIVWVIDESGSMSEEQESVADNAVTFFNRAIAYGLDFRMGVVDVNRDNQGLLCTGSGESGDYFLGPQDISRFQACVIEPWGGGEEEYGSEYGITQGYNALVNHLPRAENDPHKFREDAAIVIIYASDERAEELKQECNAGEDSGMVSIDPSCMNSVIGPTIQALEDNLSSYGVAGKAHAIIGPPPDGCDSADQVGQGYYEIVQATGGIIGSVCQTDLGPTLQLIIDDIVASASPVVLKHVPISLSLAASKDGIALERSRDNGFDYRASANSIVFIGQQFDPQHPSEIVVSYHRWVTDVVPVD